MTQQARVAARATAAAPRVRPLWARVLSGGIVSLLVLVAGIFAVRADGVSVHDVALTDGSVWVSGGRTSHWGRVNTGAHGLDLVVTGAGTSTDAKGTSPPDVLQDGRHVVGVTTGRALVAIDARTGDRLGSPTQMPEPKIDSGAVAEVRPDLVAMHGDTIAVVDWNTGDLWARRLDPDGATSIEGMLEEAPLVPGIGAGAAVTVTLSGDVLVVSAKRGAVVRLPAQEGGFGPRETTDLGVTGRAMDITAVGDDWVVTDLEQGEVHASGLDRPQTLPDGGGRAPGEVLSTAVLQQPGPDADVVAVQTFEGASFVRISDSAGGDGEREVVSGLSEGGERAKFITFARPLVSGDCLYAAWSRGGGILWGRTCTEGSTPVAELRAQGDPVPSTGVVVRHHRGQLLLNDLDSGRVFDLSLSGDTRIDTWPGGAPRAPAPTYVPDHLASPPTTSSASSTG